MTPGDVRRGEEPFRACGCCGQVWQTWEDLVLDPGLRLLGLQANGFLPDANLLVFEHRCGSSVSVLTSRLRQRLPDAQEASALPSLRGTEQCNGYCLHLENLEQCDRPCVNARDRRLILRVMGIKRQTSLP